MPTTSIAPRDRAAARALIALPNVGPATARDLLALGIRAPEDLRGRDPEAMYAALCRKDGIRYDPCLLDVFLAIVDHAKGARARPWWRDTPRRMKADAVRSQG